MWLLVRLTVRVYVCSVHLPWNRHSLTIYLSTIVFNGCQRLLQNTLDFGYNHKTYLYQPNIPNKYILWNSAVWNMFPKSPTQEHGYFGLLFFLGMSCANKQMQLWFILLHLWFHEGVLSAATEQEVAFFCCCFCFCKTCHSLRHLWSAGTGTRPLQH